MDSTCTVSCTQHLVIPHTGKPHTGTPHAFTLHAGTLLNTLGINHRRPWDNPPGTNHRRPWDNPPGSPWQRQSQAGSLLLVFHVHTLGRTGSAKTTIRKLVTCCWATWRSILTPGMKSDISANDPPAIRPAITWVGSKEVEAKRSK